MKLKKILWIIIISSNITFSQTTENLGCATGEILFPEKEQNCQKQSDAFYDYYRHKESFVPNELYSVTKTIHVNLVVWQRQNGSGGGFIDDPAGHNRINSMFNVINNKYQNVGSALSPVTYPVEVLNDSKLRIELDSVYFVIDPTPDSAYFYGPGSPSYHYASIYSLNQYMYDNIPGSDRALNIHLTGGAYSGAGGYSESNGIQSFIHTAPHMSTNDIHDWWFGNHWAHEIGHSVDMNHTYDVNNQNCNPNNLDFLSDVYDINNSCLPTCQVCIMPSVELTNNNLMGGQNIGHISALQMGIMHRAVMTENKNSWGSTYGDAPDAEVRNHVTGYSEVPFEVSNDEIWDFTMKFYQDVVVKTGAILTIQCEIQFVPEAKLVIEPGAKLIIDGGKVTNEWYYRKLWRGIEVHGNRDFVQNTTNQGVLEMKNGGIIEHAENGIRTIEENEFGLNWNKTGGIIKIYDGEFRNCKRGIEFMSYHNVNPSGVELNNISFIHNADFIIDEGLPDGAIPYVGISMYDVKGIKIINSTFENQRPDLTSVTRDKRGSGIHTIDATYKVQSGYYLGTGNPIPDTENEFINLFYGVLTTGGTSLSNVIVKDNYFENCAYSVGLHGNNYGLIARNSIMVPGGDYSFQDPVTGDWFNHGFGVYTLGAYGFNIEANTISSYLPSGLPLQAIHSNNSSNIASGKIYRNNITNVTYGTQTLMNNQWLTVDCNGYTKGNISDRDIFHAQGTLSYQGICVGNPLLDKPVKNEFFGACNNSNLAQVFRNSSANPFQYRYQNLTLDPSCHNIGSDAVGCSPSTTVNLCPNTIPSNITFDIANVIQTLQAQLLNITGEITYLKQVLATGNDQTLYDAINTENGAELKNTLDQASPYLSDGVLIAYLSKVPTPPYGYIMDLITDHSALTEDVKAVVDSLNMPIGITNVINSAQNNLSERSILEGSIKALNTERLNIIDEVVRIYLDTNWIDSAVTFLENQGATHAVCALVPIEMREDTTRVTQHIDSIRIEADNIELIDPNDERIVEMRGFCDFHEVMKKVSNRLGGYFAMTHDEKLFVQSMAESGLVVAENAKAILNFVNEHIQVYSGVDPEPDTINSNRYTNYYEDSM